MLQQWDLSFPFSIHFFFSVLFYLVCSLSVAHSTHPWVKIRHIRARATTTTTKIYEDDDETSQTFECMPREIDHIFIYWENLFVCIGNRYIITIIIIIFYYYHHYHFQHIFISTSVDLNRVRSIVRMLWVVVVW